MKRILSVAIAVGLLMQPVSCYAESTEAEKQGLNLPIEGSIDPSANSHTAIVETKETPAPRVSESAVDESTVPPTEAPATNTPTASASVAASPATTAPITNAPATDAPASNAPTADAPATDVPAMDTPATDAPTTDAPTTDAPPTDTSTTDTPTTDAPTTDAPATDAPTTDVPTTDAPTTDAPPTDAPATDAPTTDAPPTGAPATDAPETDSDIPSDGSIVVVPKGEAIPKGVQAWFSSGDSCFCGSLDAIVSYAKDNTEIWLHQPDIMELTDVSLRHLSSLKLLPDKNVFGQGDYLVVVSKDSPTVVESPEELDLTQWPAPEKDETADLFVWVKKADSEVAPDPTDPPEAEVKIEVNSDNYRAAEWTAEHPTFHLSGIPEGKRWAYAAVIYDERIVVLSKDSYTAEEEGIYTVRFVILDELGDIVSASEKYSLFLDHTLPEVSVNIDTEKDYTMYVDMKDSVSGLEALSLNGGVNWIALNGENKDSYTVCKQMTLEPGMLQVCDAAGNTWISSEQYELTKIPSDSSGFGGFGGGGGSAGGGSGTPQKPHAKATSGESDTGAEYNALAMQISDAPMTSLTIDGQELKLTLELANAETFNIPDQYHPMFTAELAAWTVDAPVTEDGDQARVTDQKKDTLLLTAISEENLGDRFEYRWKFNGEVCRLLLNSGINYIALQIGEDITVFPTEGFVGGTKYTELKMLGVSTRKFDYTVAMSFNLDPDRIPKLADNDFSENCDIAVQVEVENAKYVLNSEQKGEMYYYNVYTGPMEMMEVPYGTYSTKHIAG